MRLTHFSDVHPDWSTVQSFDAPESRSLLQLLFTTSMMDGEVTDEERETMLDTIRQLPLDDTEIDNQAIQDMFQSAQSRLRNFANNPDEFGPYLDRVCSGIEGREKRIAAMRLLAMTCVTDGVAENEIDLARAIGQRFELPADAVENILKATWESRQAHVAATNPDVSRDPKPVRSARHYEEHDMEPDQKPFTYDETSA